MINIKNKYIYLFAIILIIVLLFIIIRWNDYREKELVDVMDAEDIVEVLYRNLPLESHGGEFDRSISDSESIQELVDFFSQYRVKKVGLRNFTTKYPNEQFIFKLEYADKRITIDSLIEKDVVLLINDQYEITNGPFDYKWIEDFIERHE
ncbi:hypothetical protein I2483_17100 [Sporosarcina sp. E16_3]|uniref:hypothetical protein n=1 Tax=Sporosarcina sp. E16_3 TaxID=2789293 RepID=UPI001A91B727|nr:hypothetical protein [Sporosarcina sp. E16_3]MBO0603387.1 hypothetical protein [Sporosarcina sp. E16_3]